MFFCRQIHKHSLTEVFLVQTFPLYACITFGGYNIWNTLHVTDMSTTMSVKESETSSLCEWRQHPSTLHENNLPVLFNLHSSLPLFFPFFFFCSTSKTHSDETPRDCYLAAPLYENQIGNCFFPWFTFMQTKKLFSYFHVNVFFIGGDKCNQSSSRQGRRARRGGIIGA